MKDWNIWSLEVVFDKVISTGTEHTVGVHSTDCPLLIFSGNLMTTHNFKIGDRVKYIGSEFTPSYTVGVGLIHTIIGIDIYNEGKDSITLKFDPPIYSKYHDQTISTFKVYSESIIPVISVGEQLLLFELI